MNLLGLNRSSRKTLTYRYLASHGISTTPVVTVLYYTYTLELNVITKF